ncbi:hypothetical protein [Streptomyces cucumeris]|uniref:hypothetical protein n=1 Tax=Streptomyces cucumeris TaxID=2962890 RepID=UPI0020C8FAF3|nr:hypothetical protein [Streptomyces sp. NEAU-Y11]MCP9209565.1 hypothetical protein [Streptomyces sp. NEAU-Y11]
MKIDHYTVHHTVVDPLPESTYGTTPPHFTWQQALAEALNDLRNGRRAFVTARDKAGSILCVLPIAEYPVAGATHIDDETADAVNTFTAKMDWTI